jgi:hypothetical protein
VDRWADKDMLLNVMGYHHFHLDAAPHNRMRSDDVLFAHVTRETFTVIGIFDHAVFEVDPAKPMMAERNRLWEIFDERAARTALPGSVVVLSLIIASGHSIYLNNLSKNYARAIRETDPKLDDPRFVRCLYQQAGISVPAKPKLRWHLQYLDLGSSTKRIEASHYSPGVRIDRRPPPCASLGRRSGSDGQNRIMIFGRKGDGTYIVEFRTAAGEALAISIPEPRRR